MRTRIIVTCLIAITASCTVEESTEHKEDLRLWYNTPAVDWMSEALPVGNGFIGSMFFGGYNQEHIQFTEESLWAGGPSSDKDYYFGIRKGAHNALPQVRKLIAAQKFEEAHRLAVKELTGIIHPKTGQDFGDFGSQQTMGDLFVWVDQPGSVKDYKRELNISQGYGKVEYKAGEITYKRTFFGSYKKRVMVYHFESDAPEGSVYRVRFETPHRKVGASFEKNILRFSGEVADNGMKFETCFKVQTREGDVKFAGDSLIVSGSRQLTIIHTAATDYNSAYPGYHGGSAEEANSKTLAMSDGLDVKELLEEHLQDYHSLFDRVGIVLGSSVNDSLPANERQLAYQSGHSDLALEALYFQYGRYLMISSSRPGTLPMHLQGKWNHSTMPPWACDYHTNINVQMLYWPAEVTNLSECHEPLFDYMQHLVEPGKLAAKEHFNTRGWTVNAMNNAFGFTAPGWDFPWGFFPGGAAWLCQHAWEHYAFTQDTTYLREMAFPMMKEAALFWIDYLTEDEKGFLVSTPSYSPEHGTISAGVSMDHQIAWDILNNCVMACDVLGIEKEFRVEAKKVRDRIYPPKIGKWGQLQEWKEDIDDAEDHHRHVSHLFALHPGHQITVEETPELAQAAKTSLMARGDDGTGWSLAWKISFWARLKDGDHARELLKKVLRPVAEQGYNMSGGGGSYANLLDAHPPFQLDGNMGATAGMAEMLLQSHTGKIELLPALPVSWTKGYVTGLRARGGFTVDLYWESGKLTKAVIKSDSNKTCTILYRGKNQEIQLTKGENKSINF